MGSLGSTIVSLSFGWIRASSMPMRTLTGSSMRSATSSARHAPLLLESEGVGLVAVGHECELVKAVGEAQLDAILLQPHDEA